MDMESLAPIYVSIVAFLNVLYPQANLPQVLGVQIAQDVTTQIVEVTEQRSDATTLDAVNVGPALQSVKEARKQAIEEFKESRSAAKENLETSREQFRESLREIKDTGKRALLERIDTRLARINEKWTTHWTNILTKLTEALARIETRATKLAQRGQDISTVEAVIAEAGGVITSAQDEVNTQAEKVYIIEITDEEGLKHVVRDSIKNLRDDLGSVRESITEARQAVRRALSALKSINANLKEDKQ